MRIADKMQFEQVKSNVSKNRTELYGQQNQAATQKRVTRPSDDPLAAARVLGHRSEIQNSEQFTKNIGIARSFLENADQSLADLTEVLVRAKELALSQANDGSSNPTSRRVTAAEVEQLLQQAVQIGNRKLGDRFLFGGYRTTVAPFDASGNYGGDDGEIMMQINKDAHVAMNIPGNWVFLGQGFSKDGVLRPTTRVPEDIKQLQISREKELATKKQMIEQKASEPPQLDVRGPASVVTATPQQKERKEAAVAEGLPAPSENNGVQGLNVFDVLQDLATGLRADHKGSIQDELDRIDDAIAQVILARSQVGARVATVETTQNALSRGIVDSKIATSNLEDADTVSLVSDITKNQATLQATLQTSGKLIQPSLLDFLR